MTTRIIIPTVIARDDIFASVTSEPAWFSGETYNAGDEVIRNDKLWRCLQDGVTSKPTVNNADWHLLGLPNGYRAWDLQLGVDQPRVVDTKTRWTDLISFELTASERWTCIAFEGLEAANIQLFRSVDGLAEKILDVDLPDTAIFENCYFDWGEVEIDRASSYRDFSINIPEGAGLIIEISPENETGEVAVGSIILGRYIEFDASLLSSTETDALMRTLVENDGLTTTVTPRAPGDSTTLGFEGARDTLQDLHRLNKKLSGTATLISAGDKSPEYSGFGLIKRTRMVPVDKTTSKLIMGFETL